MNPEKIIIISTTMPEETDAAQLADSIIEMRLAACVQITPVKSVYHWQGKIEKADEVMLVMKTRETLAAELSGFIRKKHPYETPEIITTPVLASNKEYQDWLLNETDSKPCQ